ncbi:MAG: RNA polymerase sigma factor [Clostridia bacterium]|nr:RNA polymerase sigma factor [Clostridia bacterium]
MENATTNYRTFLNGDDQGFTQIVEEYKNCLTLYINSYVSNIFIAEDLMEETFFKILIKKPKFNEKSSFKTWLYAIARNIALDYLRKNSNVTVPIENYENSLVEELTVEQQYLIKEQKIELYNAIKNLSSEYRQVLFLVYFENLSNAQVASIMKKSNRQIENLLYRAKNALKKHLEKEGFVYEEY